MTYKPYHLSLIAAPVNEPVTLSETKQFIRVDNNSDDSLISGLIQVARQSAEQFMRRSLITQTLQMSFDDYAPTQTYLVMGEVQSVERVVLIRRDGAETVINSDHYYLGKGNEKIVFDAPPISHRVMIEYIVGYGDSASDVAEPIRQGLLAHIGRMYDNRTGNNTMPIASKHLYMPYRKVSLW